jgi:predicted nucleic acid-binding protein
MRTVFLDSVGLLATWDTRDQWHTPAATVFTALLREGAVLLTTELILAECGNASSRKPYRSRVEALRRQLASQGRIALIDELLLDEAWRAYAVKGSGGAGLVDQTSFIVMRRFGISEAFTNDQHFKTAGFTALF